MSDWRKLTFGLVVLVAGPLAGQDSLVSLRRMEARLDSLRAAATEASIRTVEARITDTVTVGALRIATSERFVPVVAAAAAAAWQVVLEDFGTVALAVDTLPVIPFGNPDSQIPGDSALPELVRHFARETNRAIWRQQDSSLVEWASAVAPLEAIPEAVLGHLAQEMVTLPARPNLACLGGEVPACASALGLRVGPDTLEDWYAPEVWPGLAARYTPGVVGVEAENQDRCAEADTAACRSFLQVARLTPPVSLVGRQYLIRLALDIGGPGAIGRLCEGKGRSLDARLEGASSVPMARLLSEWSDSIRAARPESSAPGIGGTLLALGWCAALVGMALGGKRWR